MNGQAVMGKIETTSPASSAIRKADGGGWLPPRDDDFDGDGNWGDEPSEPSRLNTGHLDLLGRIGQVLAVGFVVAGALGHWKIAWLLMVVQVVTFLLMVLDIKWQIRELEKRHVRLVAAITMEFFKGRDRFRNNLSQLR